ncbi:hypothetical protein N7509_011728 [Penicillium cosmopolitanum]|uniref:Xylanolytic transcriptional activator regulatory domain-containing protein n=1 Tax=Penicillium cosmopolitanum TaxID=1131564 RepID=A0A9W9VF85_9EURO|nr:uncharacterized protein N7509_011728 [Penicillium cosmopolitanum]KAJ5378609.1 hypothetical protein N7509_011728 [Penicillium cosmopolitanum]
MPRFKGRSINACHYCRTQKVKCSGESELAQLRQPVGDNQRRVTQVGYQFTTPSSIGLEGQAIPDRLIENSTTEHFVRKLKGVYSTRSQDISGVSPLSNGSTADRSNFHDNDDRSATSDYTYIPLDNDSNHAKVFVKLPPHSYALYLLGQFESFMGSDYHWYKKKCFRAKIEATYDSSQSQAVDRIWLCCFSVVLALGESYNDGVAPSFFIGDKSGLTADNPYDGDSRQITPPGIEFFKQALLLLRPSYEEPTIEQVEALNLITFYCYSLNRRKTAYAYAGMALRLANLLGIPNSLVAHSPLEKEHHKRIWWTAVCMDIMTCTELSLAPSQVLYDDTSATADCIELSSGETEEFSDPRYLTAQVKLVRIKYHITRTISELRYGNSLEAHALIEPCLQALRNWKAQFSLSLEFKEDGTFSENTLSNPPMRTIASLLLRYNQV